MNSAEQEELKDFLRENLVIETECGSYGNNILVSLRFLNDDKYFAEATVYIPDDVD